ncbi:TPA: hypothetical protein N3B91_004357 [Vibrio parahaemolyticus]|nr:hypothetical protein [Vibrio parahaemolyticus]HCM2158302.1 hypothetical protein [Vibrio parahaemolyticus]
MNWLNINAGEFPSYIAALSNRAEAIMHGHVVVHYDGRLWQGNSPISEKEASTLIVSGWFIYQDERNNLDTLHADILKLGLCTVLKNIEAGVFIGWYEDKSGKQSVFNDYFGLSSHYYTTEDEFKLSPSAQQIGGNIDPKWQTIIQKKGHAWGCHTKYQSVSKLLPGMILDVASRETTGYVDYSKVDSISLSDIPRYLEKIAAYFQPVEKFVALSAGFDSRLLAMKGEPSSSYTWGPVNSKDVRNAAIISKQLDTQHQSFLFKQTLVKDEHVAINEWLFDGQNQAINPQFIANYEYASSLMGQAYVSLDGYLGDVLQRGVYLHYGGLEGELNKLFPWLVEKKESYQTILDNRYACLNSEERDLLHRDIGMIQSLNLHCDPLQNATAFEFLYGRGFTAMSCGGVVLNGLFNIVLPLFATPVVFKSCIEAEVHEVLNYRVFKDIWATENSPLSSLNSEGLYSPKTPHTLIPFLNLAGRVLTNYVPKYYNYGKE